MPSARRSPSPKRRCSAARTNGKEHRQARNLGLSSIDQLSPFLRAVPATESLNTSNKCILWLRTQLVAYTMARLVSKNKQDVLCELRCWRGRTVLLHKSTLKSHVLRLHLESAFVVDALKRNFHQPICVKWNPRNGTFNAFYEIETNGQPFLLVAVKIQQKVLTMVRKSHFIKTFYGVDAVPPGPYEWERKP